MSENETRTRILEAAVRVFAEKGYHETRVDDIVAESQTSKGSVYFYFPSKQEIFLALVDTFAGLLEARLIEAIQSEERGVQQVNAALWASLRFFSQYRPMAKIALVQAVGLGVVFENRRRQINDRFTHIIQLRLEQAIQDGSIHPVNAELTARAWVGALNEIVIHWMFTGEPQIEESIPHIRALLLRSIGIAEERI